jgi:hypothetical protein
MKEPATSTCYKCKREIKPGETRKYIYPIPQEPVDLQEGGYACGACAPAEMRKQLDTGLHTVRPRAPLFRHA